MKKIIITTLKDKRSIGENQPVFIIAELSANHGHNFDKALKLIDAAEEAGVDAIKLQTYTADTMTIDSDKEYFRVKVNDAWSGQTLYGLYKKAYTPWDWHLKLKEYAEKRGLVFFSTPFDNTAVDFLEKMNVPLYKIASFEVVDIPLLQRIGRTKKPVIMSRGMASIEEIDLAIKTLRDFGCPDIIILQCISSYPAKPEEMNLATIPDISKRFSVVSGLSDHSLSDVTAIAAVALGAKVIEKHLILSRKEGGPDANFSLEPEEFKQLVALVRETELSIGKANYNLGNKESENIVFRKSLFVVENVKKGEKFTAKNVRSIRPGHGLLPKYFDEIIGKIAISDIEKGTPLLWNLISK